MQTACTGGRNAQATVVQRVTMGSRHQTGTFVTRVGNKSATVVRQDPQSSGAPAAHAVRPVLGATTRPVGDRPGQELLGSTEQAAVVPQPGAIIHESLRERPIRLRPELGSEAGGETPPDPSADPTARPRRRAALRCAATASRRAGSPVVVAYRPVANVRRLWHVAGVPPGGRALAPKLYGLWTCSVSDAEP